MFSLSNSLDKADDRPEKCQLCCCCIHLTQTSRILVESSSVDVMPSLKAFSFHQGVPKGALKLKNSQFVSPFECGRCTQNLCLLEGPP